jgi:hypothetical protein
MLTYFVDYAIPGVACVVDDDVDLAAAEVCGLLDQRVDVPVVEHVSRDGEGLAAVLVDGVCDGFCFFCGGCVSYTTIHTIIYVRMPNIKSYMLIWFLRLLCTGREN